jgi:hypothetical protein
MAFVTSSTSVLHYFDDSPFHGLELLGGLIKERRCRLPLAALHSFTREHGLLVLGHALCVARLHPAVLEGLVLIAALQQKGIPILQTRCHELVFRGVEVLEVLSKQNFATGACVNKRLSVHLESDF